MFLSVSNVPDTFCLDVKKAALFGQLKVGCVFSFATWYFVFDLVGFIFNLVTGSNYLLCYLVLKAASETVANTYLF